MQLKQRILQLLQRAGLTPAEASFYLEAQDHPNLPIKDLQAKSKLSASSAYRAFESLRAAGLLTSSGERWRKNVTAEPLHKFAEKIGKEQRKLRRVELELKKLACLNEMNSFALSEDPIEIITDPEKIREKAFEMLAQPWERFSVYGSAERLIDILGEEPELNFVRERCNRGKTTDVILTEIGDYAKYFLPRSTQEMRNLILNIDPKQQDYMTYIYCDEVTIWRRDKELGNRAIVMKDPAIKKSYQHMFDTLWKQKDSCGS